jgi:hypothetical protein
MGGSAALIVPISGIVTWKSDSASSRKASNGSSVRSTSSISRTGGPPSCGSHRLQQRAADQVVVGEKLRLQRGAVAAPLSPRRCGSRPSARRSSIRRWRSPRRAPRSIAAGSACGPARRRAPWRSRSCRRPPRLRETAACRVSATDRHRPGRGGRPAGEAALRLHALAECRAFHPVERHVQSGTASDLMGVKGEAMALGRRTRAPSAPTARCSAIWASTSTPISSWSTAATAPRPRRCRTARSPASRRPPARRSARSRS